MAVASATDVGETLREGESPGEAREALGPWRKVWEEKPVKETDKRRAKGRRILGENGTIHLQTTVPQGPPL